MDSVLATWGLFEWTDGHEQTTVLSSLNVLALGAQLCLEKIHTGVRQNISFEVLSCLCPLV